MLNSSNDLLLRVVDAADPKTYNAMVQKLQLAKLQANSSNVATRFQEAMDVAGKHTSINNLAEAKTIRVASRDKAYKKFEATMLQNFVEKMFTSDTSNVFGKGEAGHIWRSMMSEAVANEMAEAGGIGIAKMLKTQDNRQASPSGAITNLYAQNQSSASLQNIYATKENYRG